MFRFQKILFFLLIVIESNAQDLDIKLVRDKYGFFYTDNFNISIISKRFLYAGRFFEGLAAASENGYVGYIDKTGKFAIQPQFEYVLPFINGIAKVWKDGEKAFIDKKGLIIDQNDTNSLKIAVYSALCDDSKAPPPIEIEIDTNGLPIEQIKITYPRIEEMGGRESFTMNSFLDNKDSVYHLNVNYGVTGFPCYNLKEIGVYKKKIPAKFSKFKFPAIIIDSVDKVKECDNNTPSKIFVRDLYIINPSKDIIINYNEDYYVQAKDNKNKWRNIEFEFPSDEYFKPDTLKTSYCLQRQVISYHGGFTTKMRVVFPISEKKEYKSGKITQKKILLVSNEIDCSINASQFVRNGFTKSRKDSIPFEDFEFTKPYSIP